MELNSNNVRANARLGGLLVFSGAQEILMY